MTEVVAVTGLRKRYGSREVLLGLDFVVEGPQILGVLGPNGAGKTTLLDLLEGLSEPSAGTIRLFGKPVSTKAYPRSQVGVVLQKEFVLGGTRVREYAELFAAIYRMRDGARRILEQAGLGDRRDLPLESLSGGEAQKLFLAAAAVHRPALLFLDEPTAHLDPAAKRQLGHMLREMSKTSTVFLTTHDLQEAASLCDSLLFLVDGQIRALGTRDSLIGDRGNLEEAFFYYCQTRIDKRGERE